MTNAQRHEGGDSLLPYYCHYYYYWESLKKGTLDVHATWMIIDRVLTFEPLPRQIITHTVHVPRRSTVLSRLWRRIHAYLTLRR